jgi:hypothetical protein
MTRADLAMRASALAAAVHRTSVTLQPFPHLVLDPVFTASDYAAIAAHLPDDGEFVRHRSPDSVSDRNPHRTAWRLKLDPHDDRTPRDPSELYLFWVALADELKSPGVRRAFLAKLGPWLPPLPDDERRLKTSVLLYRDQGGSRIGPHTDGPDKLVACIFYLPTSTGGRDCGTSLLRPRDPRFQPPDDSRYEHTRFYDRDDLFEVAATMPYRPNTALAMARSPRSFHSVSIPGRVPVRYSLMYRLDLRR